jgi:hypothetical protein
MTTIGGQIAKQFFNQTSFLFERRRGTAWLFFVLALWLGGEQAEATVYTWSGSNTSNHGWLQSGNYVGNPTIAFTASDTIYYSDSGAASGTATFGTAGTIGTLEFGAETGTNPITIAWSLPAKPVINLASGLLFDAGAGANTINVSFTLISATTTFTNNSSSIQVLSVPTGSGSLIINNGAFHFQANNAGVFTGSTTVNAGATLRVLNTTTLAGSVDVKNGGTLGGRGTIGTSLIESGGILSPGVPTAPVNPISFSDSLSLAHGSLTLLDLTNSANDTVNVANLLTYGGELRLTLSDDFNTAGIYTLFNSSSQSGDFDAFTIYNSSGQIGTLSLNSNVWSGDLNGLSYSFNETSGILDVTAIPEPGVTALLSAGLFMLFVLYGIKSRHSQGRLTHEPR